MNAFLRKLVSIWRLLRTNRTARLVAITGVALLTFFILQSCGAFDPSTSSGQARVTAISEKASEPPPNYVAEKLGVPINPSTFEQYEATGDDALAALAALIPVNPSEETRDQALTRARSLVITSEQDYSDWILEQQFPESLWEQGLTREFAPLAVSIKDTYVEGGVTLYQSFIVTGETTWIAQNGERVGRSVNTIETVLSCPGESASMCRLTAVYGVPEHK